MKLKGYLRHVNKFFSNKEKLHAVDIGANIGKVTNTLFDMGWKKVTAFEPTPAIFAKLTENTKDKNVSLHNIGVSNKKGKLFFAMAPWQEEQLTNQVVSPGFWNKKKWDIQKIKTVALDDLDLEHIDLLKIDVEGHERQVVKGAEKTIKKFKPIIVIEISFENKVFDKVISKDHGKALDILLSWGYTLYTKDAHDCVLLPEGYNG